MSQKKGKGRPAVFAGALADNIVNLIRSHGLTGTRKKLAEEGVQPSPGKPKKLMTVSLPTLGKLAHQNKVKVSRGRPRKVA